VWWREARPVMSRTIKECDRQLRNNFKGATVTQHGVMLMKDGVVMDVKAWNQKVKTVFDRREEYQKICRINYIRESSDKK